MKFALVLMLAAFPLAAHVGSPDIFYQGSAGPYRLLVTIRPPEVIPGVAEIEIRSASPEARNISIVPLRLSSQQQLAPVADAAKPSKEDPQYYTGSLWLMAVGSWQVRVNVDGALGKGTLSVPAPALAQRVLGMQRLVGAILVPLGLFLAFGLVSIAGAATREAVLEPGKQPDAFRVVRSRRVMALTATIVVGALWLGSAWWDSEDGIYRQYVFKPLTLNPSLQNGGQLALRLEDPGWLNRKTDDLLPDHNHLMHLYVVRMPGMEMVWHLHPERGEDGGFAQQLPGMPAGRYALFGDIVHANGLPETAVGEITMPATAGKPLSGDDAGGVGPPIDHADYARLVSPLESGYRMVWERSAAALRAKQPYQFRFRVEDAQGRPASDMQLYMGMQGHAAFIRTDLSVFAHVHPSGSVPMPALDLVQPVSLHAKHAMDMPDGQTMPMENALPAEVSFPYGFPRGGTYRIVVQVKRAGKIETGIFDANVES